MTSGSQSAASGSSTIALTSASCGTSVGRTASVPTNGSSSKLLTGIQTGSSEPTIRTASGGRPTSSHASRSAAASGPASVASTAPPGRETSPACAAKVTVPNGEGDDEVAGGIRIDREQGCGGAGRREVAALESAPADVAVEGPRQQSLVERDRSRRARQRIGQHILPAGRLA